MSVTQSANAAAGGDRSSALRSLLNDLSTSAGALAALTATFNARATERPLPPGLEGPVRGVLDTLGVSEAVERLPVTELRALLAELRVFGSSHQRLEAPEAPEPGWTPPSAHLIQAAGDVSAGLPQVLARMVAPRLAGLAERLGAAGSRFLDVGAGAAALSIQMARSWPGLAVVGIEPWAPALELARANVRAAGLDARIELRSEHGERLVDEASYDLGWIPSFFIAEAALPSVIERVRRALRDDAWLIMPALRADPGSLAGSVVRLRAALWGGSAPTLAEAAARLASAGLVDMQSFASAPTSATGLLAARKPGASRG